MAMPEEDIEILHSSGSWDSRIFIKYGNTDGIVCVHYGSDHRFYNGMRFDTQYWEKDEWRIKKEPEYIPFTFDDKEQLKGRWIKMIGSGDYLITVTFKEGICITDGSTIYYERLLEEYIFDDGSPCGKVKE